MKIGPTGLNRVGKFNIFGQKGGRLAADPGERLIPSRCFSSILGNSFFILLFSLSTFALPGRERDAAQSGADLVVTVPFPENEVVQVVQEIVQDGIVRGTKEYSKDQYLSGAASVSSTRVFTEWTQGGRVFYKVRLKALAPANFKDSGDVGTLAVRYVVQAQDDQHAVVRIDARFMEDFRRIEHASNGSVEGAEYKNIHDRLEAIGSMKLQRADGEKKKQALAATGQQAIPPDPPPEPPPATATTAEPTNIASATPVPPTLEEHVKDLRRQVERLVKAPGAPLKSAPFHSASTLQTLPSGTEVLVVITTPYWLGVETHLGQHGWIMRDDLELLP